MSKSKKRRIILVIMGLITIIVALVVSTKVLNSRFTDGMEYDETTKLAKYYYRDDIYVYKYAKSNFLLNGSFASVSKIEDTKMYLQEDGTVSTNGLCITLFIWPGVINYEYGVLLEDTENDIFLQLMIDENLKLCDFDDEQNLTELEKEYKSIYENNIDRVNELMEAAKEKWDILRKSE